jgi:hypothetical protein
LSYILDNRIGTASGFTLDVVTAQFFFTPDVPRQLMTAGIQWLWRAIAILGASVGAALRGFGAGADADLDTHALDGAGQWFFCGFGVIDRQPELLGALATTHVAGF